MFHLYMNIIPYVTHMVYIGLVTHLAFVFLIPHTVQEGIHDEFLDTSRIYIFPFPSTSRSYGVKQDMA